MTLAGFETWKGRVLTNLDIHASRSDHVLNESQLRSLWADGFSSHSGYLVSADVLHGFTFEESFSLRRHGRRQV